MKYYQQGDVIIKPVKELPKTGLAKLDHKILQLGETTGHMHQFDGSAAVQVFETEGFEEVGGRITPNKRKFIMVDNVAFLRHEEHKPISVPPGIYEIDIVREFDYDEMESRRVVD